MRIAVYLLFCAARMLSARQAPDDLQFNVPYICNDGHTYAVHTR